jgi:hypothetical protein
MEKWLWAMPTTLYQSLLRTAVCSMSIARILIFIPNLIFRRNINVCAGSGCSYECFDLLKQYELREANELLNELTM